MPVAISEPVFSGYHRPLFIDDPWIRGWWILDNISVSGYDSKYFWDLQVSGSPSQAPGFIRTSGMRFDGINDALMVDVSTTTGASTIPIAHPDLNRGTGLWPFEAAWELPRTNGDWISTSQAAHQMGFLMRLKMTEFPGVGLTGTDAIQREHWVLASAWEGSGSTFTNYTRQFHISIVNPSSIKYTGFTRNLLGSIDATVLTFYPHTLPSGEAFTLGFSSRDASPNALHVHMVSGSGNNLVYYEATVLTGALQTKASGQSAAAPAASKIVFGCLGQGRYPSGFFKGDIEEIIWYNGGAPKISDCYAFHSGNIQTTRPSFGRIDYPYLTTNYRMEKYYSGVAVPGNYGWTAEGQTGLTWYKDEINNLAMIVSGTLSADPGSGKIAALTLARTGPYPGLYSTHYSGIGWTAGLTQRFLSRAADYAPFMLTPPFGITVMYWMKHTDNALNAYSIIGIDNKSNVAVLTPWAIDWDAFSRSITSKISVGDGFVALGNNTLNSNFSYASGLWRHVTHIFDLNTKCGRTYVSGILGPLTSSNNILSNTIMSGQWLTQAHTKQQTTFRILGRLNLSTVDTSAPSGIFDEFIIVGDVLPSSTIYDFYTTNSGFLRPLNPTTSGEIGGYLNGIPIPTSSGYIGGYLSGVPLYGSGYVGGYLFGVYNNSGLIGGYLNGFTLETPYSGLIGGYLRGLTSGNSLIGGYIRGQLSPQQQSGIVGGYMAGVEDISLNATFYAFFNVIGRDKKEFDAAATVFKEAKAEFDARAIVYIDERYPTATIINPNIDQSGNSTPITYQFEATASGLDNKQIVFTQWFFSDIPATSGSIISNSGTYQTSHTFSKSGLFDVIFIAVDDKGLVTSDRRKINTASGLTLPTITLTATTQSGVAPLSVGFSGTINTAPAPIKDKFIYFGDNTMSVSTDSIYKLYIVPGIYIPIFRVRDSRGIIVTDSLVVGVDN